MDKKIQSLVKEAIDEQKEEVIRGFQFMLHYPFHPDATFILLELRGSAGSFGVTVTQMNGWEKQLQKNAYGENDSDLKGFGFYVYDKLQQDHSEILGDDDLATDIDDFVKEYFVSFFQECFNKAGGKNSKIPFYLSYPNSGDAYDLVKEEWTYPE